MYACSLRLRYLGIPLASQGLRVLHYTLLIERIAGQIALWIAFSLSFAGRLDLIRYKAFTVYGYSYFWCQQVLWRWSLDYARLSLVGSHTTEGGGRVETL